MSDDDSPTTPAPGPVDDADDTRGLHLRRLARHPLTLIVGGLVVIAAFAIAASQLTIGLALLIALAALLIVGSIVFGIASSRARRDFWNAYAQARRLTPVEGKTSLPPVTPLLRKGDSRYAEQRFDGVLPGGRDGSLCLYTYEEEYRDSDGDKHTTYIHFTITIADLSQTEAMITELYCQRRVGFRFMDGMEDVFRSRQRVEQESEAVDREWEIFIGEADAIGTARRILSPSFLVWMETNADENFAFELVGETLVCNVKGHLSSAAELDSVCVISAAIAKRLEEEAAQTGTLAEG